MGIHFEVGLFGLANLDVHFELEYFAFVKEEERFELRSFELAGFEDERLVYFGNSELLEHIDDDLHIMFVDDSSDDLELRRRLFHRNCAD